MMSAERMILVWTQSQHSWVYTEHVEDDADSTPKLRGRPATGQTPKRYIRAGHIWDEAAEVAAERNETMTALVVRAIEREVKRLRRHTNDAAAE